MKWFADAPSNIALIKYMGKKDPQHNTPINSSLSYTLSDLKSFVELELLPLKQDAWEPLDIPGAQSFHLSAAGQERFLRHFAFLKKYFNYPHHFIVRSCNNFLANGGLASSASSFAALTRCAVLALTELTGHPELSPAEMASLSQQGSGSSCRSFFQPWALWTPDSVHEIHLPFTKLIHQVIIVEHAAKLVSSSEAHSRITTSPHFTHRPERAEQNLQALLHALHAKDWHSAYTITWQEFEDMHQLFATSTPAFSYMSEATQSLLSELQNFWETEGDGPIVTLDAGPNIHLLYRPDQIELAHKFRIDKLLGNYDVIS